MPRPGDARTASDQERSSSTSSSPPLLLSWPEQTREDRQGSGHGGGPHYHHCHQHHRHHHHHQQQQQQQQQHGSVSAEIESAVDISSSTALSMHGRAVDGSVMMPACENEGGVVAMKEKFSPGWNASLRDAEGLGCKKRLSYCQLWSLVKVLAILAALEAAVMLVITQRQGGGGTRGTRGNRGSGVVVASNNIDATTAATRSVPYSRGLRSETFKGLFSPGTKDGEPLATSASTSSPLSTLSASSLPHRSRSLLGDAAMSVSAGASGGVGGVGGSGGVSGAQEPSGFERRARIGYLIMASGIQELHKTKRLLKAIYDPNNFYLVHLDRKDNRAIRRDIEDFIQDWDNVRMLVPSLDVSWGGYTITLTAIFGICTMVQWSDEWDFFINLSASDFPLLPQDELTTVLGQYKDMGMNFVSGAPLNDRNRVEVLIDDQGLYRETQTSKASRPLKVGKPRLPPSKSMFTVYKGEFWVVLHRSFCRYIEASPDNVARSLQAYFSRFRISDESYFQTVLCHPLAPNFRVQQDNLRFVSWPAVSEGHYVLHPDPITGGIDGNLNIAMDSGALFARKFDLEVSREAYTLLEESLSKPNPTRLAMAANRLSPATTVNGRQMFCAIPDGYSIQEVLSHPPKTAMAMSIDNKKSATTASTMNENRGGSPFSPANGQDPSQGQPLLQARDAREGQGKDREIP